MRVFAFPAMDCDITGGPYDGRLYVAYMDWAGSDHDIFFRRSDDQGVTWSSPIRINDDAFGNGRDQFHPWTTVSDDGVVNIVFYDRRNDPSNLLMDLYVTQSFDGGVTFEPNVRVTTVSSDPTAGSLRAGLIGEYIGLAASSASRLHPVWTDTRLGHQDVFTSIVDTTFVGVPDGVPGSRVSLGPAAPNPAHGPTRLAYSAPGADEVVIRIHDVVGRLVWAVTDAPGRDGSGAVTWDGTDAQGESVASGIYFASLSAGDSTARVKIVAVR